MTNEQTGFFILYTLLLWVSLIEGGLPPGSFAIAIKTDRLTKTETRDG